MKTASIEHLYSTTPRTLLEIDTPELGELGLLDCPMHITTHQEGNQSLYEVNLDTPPLDAERVLGLLNYAAPSSRDQSFVGIEGDWKYALEPQSDIYAWHSRLGKHWTDFVENAPTYLELTHSANTYWYEHQDIERVDQWLGMLPEPIPFDADFFARATQMNTKKLLAGLAEQGYEDCDFILDEFIKKAAESTWIYTEIEGGEQLRAKFEAICRISKRHRRVMAFAGLCSADRKLVQGSMVRHITSDQSYTPSMPSPRFGRVRFIIDASWNDDGIGLRLPQFKRVFDRDGRDSIVNLGKSLGFDIPRDYRTLAKATVETVSDAHRYHEADALIVKLGGNYSGGRDVQKTFVDKRTVRQTRRVTMSPRIGWTATKLDSGRTRVDWDLTSETLVGEAAGVPTTHSRNGLLGLIVVAAFSADVRANDNIWKTKKDLPERERLQEMGAAQLPLLALMFRNQLARSQFVERVSSLQV